ncbi:hypothetical protein EJB05_35711, partial [Eragrostis curvula]
MATPNKSGFSLQDATLHPPAHSADDDDGEIPWVLVDEHAYVADCRNATTAFATTWDNKDIQVTFCIARPPRVSYICVFCPGREHNEFPLEPKIIAMTEDLVLLRIIVSSKWHVFEDMDYYIYQAADRAAGGGPSLKRLPRPPQPYKFDSPNAGILRCGTSYKQRHEEQNSRFVLRRPDRDITDDDDFYVVAGLCTAHYPEPGEFVLCHYNSKVPTRWNTDTVCVSLNKQQRIQHGCYLCHGNYKVIAIGGDAGTMGFVDLWRGIIFCDVLRVVQGLKPIPPLGYVALPPPLVPDLVPRGDARLSRDIAVVEGDEGRIIKYVQLVIESKPSEGLEGSSVIEGWMSETWKIPVSASSTYSENSWVRDCRCESSHILVDDSNPHFELLPKVLDHEGKPLPPFKKLDIRQPTLSLHGDDGIVYFMVKKNPEDPKAWVVAVDMRKNALQEVAKFAADRTVVVTFAYVHSRISKYLR